MIPYLGIDTLKIRGPIERPYYKLKWNSLGTTLKKCDKNVLCAVDI